MKSLKSKKLIPLCLVLSISMILISCAGNGALRYEKFSKATEAGDFQSIAAEIKKNPKLYGKTNQFLYYFDIGLLYHYASQFDSSTVYLLKAVDIHDQLFAKSITNEAAAFLTNDNIRPYRSKPYELTLAHQLLALNFLAQGRVDDALVEVRRAQLKFDEWARKDKKHTKFTSDGLFHLVAAMAYDQVGQSDNAMISLYLAIEAYKKGPVKLPKELEKYAICMFRKNDRSEDIIKLGLDTTGISANCNYKNQETEIVVLGYAGKGPNLKETTWWGTYVKDGVLILNYNNPTTGEVQSMTMQSPALPDKEYEKASKGEKTKSGTTFHIKVSLPAVDSFRTRVNSFTATTQDGIEFNSFEVNNLDLQVAENLKDNWGTILTRTVVRVVLRTITAEKAKKEMNTSSPIANLLLNVGTDILADQLEHADTRSCFLIPKSIQIIRIPVKEGNHSIEIATKDSDGKSLGTKTITNVNVRAGEKKYIWYSYLH